MPAEAITRGDEESDVPPNGGGPRRLQPLPACPDCGDSVVAERVLERMAAALRELREHIPAHAWWDSGAAATLLEYQARYRPNQI
jgi:hypothetical protein